MNAGSDDHADYQADDDLVTATTTSEDKFKDESTENFKINKHPVKFEGT